MSKYFKKENHKAVKALYLIIFGCFIYFSTATPISAESPPALPLPPCEIVDGVQVGACLNDSEFVSISVSGDFSAGNTVQVLTDANICSRFDNADGFSPAPCASAFSSPSVNGCFSIDLRDNNIFKQVACNSLYRNGEGPAFIIENDNNQRCGGRGDFATFIFGGPGNVPGARWTERAPAAQRCNIKFDSPRPDALIGPTWVKVSNSATIHDNVGRRFGELGGVSRVSEGFVRVDGDLVELPPVAAFDTEVIGRMVNFSNTSFSLNGSPLTYEWNFGDGNTSTSQIPEHVYETAGRFDVTLTVTDENDRVDEAVNSVTTEDRLAIELEMESVTLNPGEEHVVNVTAYNFEAEDIEDFSLSLDIDETLLTLVEGAAPPVLQTIARDGSTSTRYIIRAEDSGETNISVTGEGSLTPSALIVQDIAEQQITINPDLNVTLETSVDEFTRAGDEVTITLTLVNNEDFTIDGIRVESLGISPNELLEFVSGPLDPDGNDPRVSPLALGAGETTTVTFTYIATQRGVVELTSTLASNNPFNGTRFFQSTDTTLAIETADFRLTNLRLQPERPVPGEIVSIRGEIENTGSLDIVDIDFELTPFAPDIQVLIELLEDLDPDVSPQIALLEPGADNTREFIIPVFVEWDVVDETRYTLNVDFTANAIVEGEEIELLVSETLRGDLDRTEYWRDTLDFTFQFFRDSYNGAVTETLDGIDLVAEGSLLGGTLVGRTEGVLNVLQRFGDGFLTAGDLVISVASEPDVYTEEGLMLAQLIIDYAATTSRKQLVDDLISANVALADLEDQLILSAVNSVEDYLGDVKTAFIDGNTREFNRLITEPQAELVLGLGVEGAAAQMFSRVVRAGRARGLIKGRQKGVSDLSRELLQAADDEAARIAGRLVAAEARLFKNAPEGVNLTARIAAAAGLDGRELAFMLRNAKRVQPDGSQVTYFVRPRPQSATRHAAAGLNAKPLGVKFKSVNDIDYKYLGYNRVDEGLVVLTEPASIETVRGNIIDAIIRGDINPNTPEGMATMRMIWSRLSVKQNDFNTRNQFLEKFNATQTHMVTDSRTGFTAEVTQPGTIIQRFGNDVVTTASIDSRGRLTFDFNGREVYSDVDLLSVARVDGTNLDASVHMRILNEAGFGFDRQHHATAQTSDFPDARVARDVAEAFLTAHSRGGEALLVVGPNGITKTYVESFELIPLNEVQNEVGDLAERFVGKSGYDLYGQIVRNVRYSGLGAGQ